MAFNRNRIGWRAIVLLLAACSKSTGSARDSGPATQCSISGVVYPAAALNPSDGCQICQPLSSADDWSTLSFGSACGAAGAVCVSGSCLAGCAIDGVFYPPDSASSQAACSSCQPQLSTTTWSPLTGPSGSCDAGDICVNGACKAGCQIAGAVVAPGAANQLNVCQACDPTANPSGWSPTPDGTACGGNRLCMSGSCQAGCLVPSGFYLATQLNPQNACQTCQPDLALTSFSPVTGLPPAGACDAGQVCASGACASGCFIDSAFEISGARNQYDSSVCCSPQSSTQDWTSAFVAQGAFGTGAGPMGVAVADFNADGRLDLATVNRSDGTVSVFFSATDGGYIGPLVLQVGAAPVAIVAADLNGDKLPDLVVANADDGSVSVLLNAGAGFGFKAQKPYGTLGNPSSLAIADLDGDGVPDLAVANLDQGTVTVLLGVGSGSFANASVPIGVGHLPQAIVAGDLNGDSIIDLAVANASDGTIDVLINGGKAAFASPVPYNVGTHPAALIAVDLNGDGKLDLVVANAFDDSLGVLLNKGNGTFPPQTVVALGVATYSLAVGDFNRDGIPDVAIADYNGGRAGVLLNEGNGTLASPFYAAVGLPFSAFGLAAGDLNGDGLPDLAVVGLDDSTLQVLINSCP